MAYELELSPGSRVHNVFHVSCLKKALRQQVTAVLELPPLDDDEHLILEPETILDSRDKRFKSRFIGEF